MKCLWIFNPDTDFARGEGNRIYTPNAKVRSMRRLRALSQAPLASIEDTILLLDGQTEEEVATLAEYEQVQQKGIKLIGPDQLKHQDWTHTQIAPWGWDYTIRERLIRAGVPERYLPSRQYVENLRLISHRRNTIPFHRLLATQGLHANITSPAEIYSLSEAKDWIHQYPDSFLKAPWSSSGRGVMRTYGKEETLILEWVKGTIRRQGSVMAEIHMKKTLDFATEWEITPDGISHFLGFSLFYTDNKGRYKENLSLPQVEIRKIISSKTSENIDAVTTAQQHAISILIAPYYHGPAGIDMLIGEEGNINGCVELNLRYTMGHLTL